MKGNRDLSIDILKGIGILMVVVGHSGCPATLRTLIYMVHMPLFFMASGYFLKVERLLDVSAFFKSKVKSLYIPFVKYAIPILLLHNLLIRVGIMSTRCGAQYYDLVTAMQELILRVVFMEVHGEQLLGTFWFLQALFVSNILLSILFSLTNTIWGKPCARVVTVVVMALALIFSAVHYALPELHTVCLYRISLGAFFLCIGRAIRQGCMRQIPTLLLMVVFFAIFALHPASMKEQSNIVDFLSIAVSGPCGFLILLRLSRAIGKIRGMMQGKASRWLSQLGQKSLGIMTFHFLSFKIISLIIVLYYGRGDYYAIGTHPCIHIEGSCWWPAYSVVGVYASMAIDKGYSLIVKRCIRLVRKC